MTAAWWVVVVANNQDVEERRVLRQMRRRLRDATNPFDTPEPQFVQLYRLTRDAVRALCDELRPHIPERRRKTGIKLEFQVLATLSLLASGSYQRRVGQDFLSCMSQTSVSVTVHTVIRALKNIMNTWIKFPVDHATIDSVKEQFWVRCGFPGVIGAVDGTHIAIFPPGTEREHLYINRKLYHSLNVLVVSDYNGKILAVNAAHGGRTHDARVWNASRVSVHLQERHEAGRTGTWLLGDSGYALLPYLLTPKLNAPAGSPAARYTDRHVRARSAIERMIGVLKGRWRCLRKERALHYAPEFASLIVNRCCVLHNLAKFHNVPEPEYYLDEIDRDPQHLQADDRILTGNQVREQVIRWYFTN